MKKLFLFTFIICLCSSLVCADGFNEEYVDGKPILETSYDITCTATIEGAVITEGGNAVYNSSEVPGGELGGTWASPTVDSGIHDDEYLKQDQTIPQTIINGIPVFSAGLAGGSTSQLGIDVSGNILTTGTLGAGATTLSSLNVDTGTLAVNLAGYEDKVGIGTAVPTEKLSITGNLLASGTLALIPMTTGSVPYFGANGILTQNNSQLFWDAGNLRFGFGPMSADLNEGNGKLVVGGTKGAAYGGAPTQHLWINDNAAYTVVNRGGSITFGAFYNSTQQASIAAIESRVESGAAQPYFGSLAFLTRDTTASDGTSVKMIIKATGKVGIGSTTPDEALDIGNGGKLTTHSLGDDKSLDSYHDDTHAHINTVTSGNLKLQSTAIGNVTLFEDTDVADAANGKAFKVYRMAAEGDSYVSIWGDQWKGMNIDSSGVLYIESLGVLHFNPNSGQNVTIGLNAGAGENPALQHNGYLTAVTDERYIQWQVNDATDNFELTREDANILAFDVQMPFTANTISADNGFTGTGSYTSFTIVGGIITNAS